MSNEAIERYEQEEEELFVDLYPGDGDVFLGKRNDGEIHCVSYEEAKNTLARLNLLLERVKIVSEGG